MIAIGRTDLPAILRALAKTDLLVSGGGSLLQDVTGRWTIPIISVSSVWHWRVVAGVDVCAGSALSPAAWAKLSSGRS